MINIATKLPKYLPHMQHKDAISMGMKSLDPRHWIEPDEDYPRYLEHKLRLRELQQQHIFDALPSAYAAQQELAIELKRHLLKLNMQCSMFRHEFSDTLFVKPLFCCDLSP